MPLVVQLVPRLQLLPALPHQLVDPGDPAFQKHRREEEKGGNDHGKVTIQPF